MLAGTNTVVCHFSASSQLTVPAGVTSMSIATIGVPGQTVDGSPGGLGADVKGQITVTPGV